METPLLKVPETDADHAWAPRQAPFECCMDASNLHTIEKDAHVLVRRCKCGRRHFKALMLIPGAVAIHGTPTRG